MSGSTAPAKPWERKGAGQAGSSSATPLGPSTANDGAAKPWEVTTSTSPGVGGSIVNRSRPWDSQASSSGYGASSSYNTNSGGGYGSSTYGGYNSGSTYGRPGYGSMYNSYGSSYPTSRYGGLGGSSYGGGYGGMGGNAYSGGYGSLGGGFGSGYGNGYGSSYGGGYGGMGGVGNSYGMGGYGSGMSGPYGQVGQFGPEGPPPQPPTAWQHALHAIGGVVNFFGRISFLVDENAHAFHFFISALLQLLDRGGSLYGELARFVLRLLGFKEKSKDMALQPRGPPGSNGLPPGGRGQPQLPGIAPAGENFDNVWHS